MSFWYVAEVAQVVRRAARRDERQPDEHAPRAAPTSAALIVPRDPCVARNQAANGTMNGSAWGLVIRLTASRAATRPGRPAARRQDREHRRQHVDRLVLAPPRGHVPGRRPEQDGAHAASSASPRPVAEPPAHGRRRSPRSASARRHLHQRPDRGVGRVGHGPERGLDRRQRTPDPGHDGREATGSGRRRGSSRSPRSRGPTGTNWSTSPTRPAAGQHPQPDARCPARTGRGSRPRARSRRSSRRRPTIIGPSAAPGRVAPGGHRGQARRRDPVALRQRRPGTRPMSADPGRVAADRVGHRLRCRRTGARSGSRTARSRGSCAPAGR